MLRTDLIELINSGEAWAFVGSGASADGGLPDWGALVVEIVGRLPADRQSEITGSQKWAAASKRSDYPGQFDAIERVVGREELEGHVRETITAGRGRPGRVLNAITDWPFAGYVTTNYDGLLEDALRPRITGWPRIGNSDGEIRKVSGGAKDLVWHIHGSLDLPPEMSKLILTDADYDRLYLDDSPLKTQLRGFLTNHRVVFFGFSFRDLELQRTNQQSVDQVLPEGNPVTLFLGVALIVGGYTRP